MRLVLAEMISKYRMRLGSFEILNKFRMRRIWMINKTRMRLV